MIITLFFFLVTGFLFVVSFLTTLLFLSSYLCLSCLADFLPPLILPFPPLLFHHPVAAHSSHSHMYSYFLCPFLTNNPSSCSPNLSAACSPPPKYTWLKVRLRFKTHSTIRFHRDITLCVIIPCKWQLNSS